MPPYAGLIAAILILPLLAPAAGEPGPARSATTTSASSGSRTPAVRTGPDAALGRARRADRARARTRSCWSRTDVTARTARAARSTPRPGPASAASSATTSACGTWSRLWPGAGIAAIAPDLNGAYTGGWGEPNDRARWPRIVNRTLAAVAAATPPEAPRFPIWPSRAAGPQAGRLPRPFAERPPRRAAATPARGEPRPRGDRRRPRPVRALFLLTPIFARTAPPAGRAVRQWRSAPATATPACSGAATSARRGPTPAARPAAASSGSSAPTTTTSTAR